MRAWLLAASGTVAMTAGCAIAAPPPPMTPAGATVAAQNLHDQLFQLFKDDDEASLKLNPMNAIYRGDLRYADQFGDYISDAYYDATRSQAKASLARLHAIDRARLDATDQLAWDVFDFATKDQLEGLSPRYLALTEVRPLNHFYGQQSSYPSYHTR